MKESSFVRTLPLCYMGQNCNRQISKPRIRGSTSSPACQYDMVGGSLAPWVTYSPIYDLSISATKITIHTIISPGEIRRGSGPSTGNTRGTGRWTTEIAQVSRPVSVVAGPSYPPSHPMACDTIPREVNKD